MTNIRWSSNGREIPKIEPHSQAKHCIIETYITNLIHTLYGKGRYGVKNFTFIDGFCGGGLYQDDNEPQGVWYGSPIRLIKAVRRGFFKSRRNYELNVQFIFIDDKQDHIDFLKNFGMPHAELGHLCNEQLHSISHENNQINEQCLFYCGEFEKLVDLCLLKSGLWKGHSFFLLDPCGWTDVSMKSIRKIQQLKKSEILYTFMIDFIARFLKERNTNLKNAFDHVLEAEDYYNLEKIHDLANPSVQCYLRNESLRLFREKGKFKHVFTFSMIPKGEKRTLYYLIHLSQNLTALQVMKDSFWQENNSFYRYYFELYGFIFRTVDFYEEQQLNLLFDINNTNYEYSLKKLYQQLSKLMEQEGELSFLNLCERTMEINPANLAQYNKLLNRLR